jgi:mannose/fructose/N-acetylgalactosamine-specific phosphotransferase system component IIB
LIRKNLERAEKFIQTNISNKNDATAMLHIGGTIAQAHLKLNDQNSFPLLQTYRHEFSNVADENRGNYTISDIKNEVKMHIMVQETESQRFKKLLKKGIDFAKKYNYSVISG